MGKTKGRIGIISRMASHQHHKTAAPLCSCHGDFSGRSLRRSSAGGHRHDLAAGGQHQAVRVEDFRLAGQWFQRIGRVVCLLAGHVQDRAFRRRRASPKARLPSPDRTAAGTCRRAWRRTPRGLLEARPDVGGAGRDGPCLRPSMAWAPQGWPLCRAALAFARPPA